MLDDDKNKIDSDADGLTDEQERIIGTNPNAPDTDKDGMSDGDEVRAGRNPRGSGNLRDLFIPHKGNDYKPHALHPKRVLFYAVSGALIKALVVGFMVVLPIGAWLTPDVLRQQAEQIISLTNVVRQNVGLASLLENNLLTQAALGKAQDMLLNQYFSHLSPNNKGLANWLKEVGYDFTVAGENLAMGFADSRAVMNAWQQSPTHYANLVDPVYSEIGVGAVIGPFSGYDTTLVAQYFGLPVKSKPEQLAAPTPVSIQQNKTSTPAPAPTPEIKQESEVLPEKIDEQISKQDEASEAQEELILAKDTSPDNVAGESDLGPSSESPIIDVAVPATPTVDLERSRLVVVEPEGQKDRLAKAIVYLSEDAAGAEVVFSNYRITLAADPQEPGLWTGQTIVFSQDEEQIFNPVVLPSLIAWNAAGGKLTTDIGWQNVLIIQPSLEDQYFLLKSSRAGLVGKLLSISSIYFKIILILAVIALLLNTFIEIRKQHAHLILSTLGLIGLFLLFILV